MEIIIRPYEDKDEQAFRQATIDLQNYECTFDPEMLTGNESGDALVTYVFERNKNKDGKIFIAEVDGKTVGFICLHVELKGHEVALPDIKCVTVTGLFINTEFRGKGIGKQLLHKAEEYAKERNLSYVKLGVFAENKNAKEIYAHSGFQDYEVIMVKKI